VKFAFISAEKVAFSVAAICRLLAVSPSGYFAAQKRPRSLHARRDEELSSLAFDFLRMIRGILFPRAHACPGQTNCTSADGHLCAASHR
jgi:hypothetical protein